MLYFAAFFKKAGYNGLPVLIEELVKKGVACGVLGIDEMKAHIRSRAF